MHRSKKRVVGVLLGLMLFVAPLVLISFVSLDLYDMLDVEEERILFRAAYPLLFATVLLGFLFRAWYDQKDREPESAFHDTYGKLLFALILLDGLSFIVIVVFQLISLAPIFQMFLFLQVAIVSLLRARLFLD
jgi:hypothetical protein